MKNYYEILEVNEKASKETISKVFKMQIKKNHPDIFQGEEKKIAEEKTMLLNEAYEVLSDETKRSEYDKQISFEKEEQITYLNEQIHALKEELIKEQMLLQQISEEVDLEQYRQRLNIQNRYNPHYVPYENQTYTNGVGTEDRYRDLKQFGFKLIIFILGIIGILFILGQILDRNILGELFKEFFIN